MTLTATGMPLHRQLYLVLRDQISSRTLAPGHSLPSEHELGELYGVSRITVRRALQELSDEGAVVKRPGRGTFVADDLAPEAPRSPMTMRDVLRRAHDDTLVTVVEYDHRVPPAQTAASLGLGPSELAVHVRRVRSIGAAPVMITDAWVPMRFAERVTEENLHATALFELLEHSGVTFGKVIQEITGEVADPVRAALLDVDIGSALLRIDRLMYDQAGHPVLFNSITVTPSRTRIVAELSAVDGETETAGFFAHTVIRSR